MFRLRTTPSGQPPATADLLRTIERGLPGSSMPSFRFLSEDERKEVAAYVLSLADLLDGPEPAPVAAPGAPVPATTESTAKGKELYALMGCASCHGTGGKGDGPSAKTLLDDDGKKVKVRDFTDGVFRGGGEPLDLYYRFVTGMDGTPMPGFGEALEMADRWALVDYVTSLRAPPAAQPLPADPIQAGRIIAARYSCQGCHVLDNGKGGAVGPDLRVSGQKLSGEWVRTFLQDPRAYGKIYPGRPHRMPHLGISREEALVLSRYLMAMGKRKSPAITSADAAQVSEAQLTEGKNIYILRCTQCHNLGSAIPVPLATQQGPDLARVLGRVDYQWTQKWILDPKKIDPATKMTTPGITPAQAEAVRAFVWKVAAEESAKGLLQ